MKPFQIPLAILLALAVAGTGVLAAEGEYQLPDIGSSAASVISPAQERQYGAMLLREYRRAGLVLDDPLLDGYMSEFGYRLVAASERPQQDFTFFLLRDREINAFATLGGYIAVNAGLFLTAQSEDEVAGVLAHEIAHVTQRHVLRSVERAQRDSLPMALAMLGAMIAASQAGGDGDAAQAALATGMSLMQQRQINYTRSNEQEADRIGIRALARAGYDPSAMAVFFERMQRSNRSALAAYFPDYLRTHPVTLSRISEARDRARGIAAEQPEPRVPPTTTPLNPLLPAAYADAIGPGNSGRDHAARFAFARERLRVLSAESPMALLAEYRQAGDSDDRVQRDARAYGLALAQLAIGDADAATRALEPLAGEYPGLFWPELALAEAEHQAGRRQQALQRFDTLLRRLPDNPGVALAYARAMIRQGNAESARLAQDVLRPLLNRGDASDPAFQSAFARAAELAGDTVRAGEAHAEAAWLGGRPEDALNQLERLKRDHSLDYYQRARIDARIAAITPAVLEARRRGIRAGDAEREHRAAPVALRPRP